ncbi:radical SAM family heme chaperone HemW [Alteromonas aestuariivivens]|uniref:Heme chaperone HemW n=1 Tax=Alteromonas aestuariivivens TaxID=1938339 RepID=A0A3D8M3Y0_9ALTE|nr:radical SAM family heme chaperone HemW [Alteromonas aestuariivivens]RDV24341.1 radical SAM family heme chaperone HemW [Alteromonas aestuariivivens]
MRNPPLGLYIHIPWCVQKCPYCDFNSHGMKSSIPEQEYVSHLLADLAEDAKRIGARPVQSIFIGGGTPSLFSESAVEKLLSGVRQRINLAANAEITLEANPGTVEAGRFSGYAEAGVNRISIGVQSFQQQHLEALGRIHDSQQALQAIQQAHLAGLNSFNTDLMHGLPDQSLDNALSDLHTAIQQRPQHISWYQLTIEPNTPFYSKPPKLPDDDILWDIQSEGHRRLSEAGYQQYEISAYSQPGSQCQHNLNYWRFGDYLGIGCGAHGKITDTQQGTITRTVKVKHPRGYMELTRPYLDHSTRVEEEDLPFEFFMNRFRLVEPCPTDDYPALTGQALPDTIHAALEKAQQQGLLEIDANSWQVTPLGRRYLNSLLEALV